MPGWIPILMMLVLMPFDCTTSWSAQSTREAGSDQFDTGSERIGSLRLGLAEKAVHQAVSCKPKKGKEIFEAATGDYVQEWAYPDCGVVLKMSSERKGGRKSVASITVTSPGKLETSRGIRIGSAESEVIEAYGRFRDPESALEGGGELVAGSVYDGMIFEFRDGRVVRIFLGAAAE
ncbi:MAG: hypothetical protein AB9873_09385 [Syntrophobacteraceae bacterium]